MDERQKAADSGTAISGSLIGFGASGFLFLLESVRAVGLARLLLPEAFGVFALAIVFSSMQFLFKNWGFDLALVQHPGGSKLPLRSHFTLNMGLTTLVALVAIPLAWLLGWAYPDETALPLLIMTLAAIEWFGAIPATALALLQRKMHYRALAWIDILGSSLATILSLGLAFQGAGAFSLVGIPAGMTLGRLAGALLFQHALLYRPDWKREDFRKLVRFGSPLFLTKALRQILHRFDDFWIGTVGSSTGLGWYTKSWGLTRRGSYFVQRPLEVTFLPIWSRQIDHPDLLRSSLRHVIGSAGRFLGPLLFLIGWTATEWIPSIFGDPWVPMRTALLLLLPWMAINVFQSLMQVVLTAANRHAVLPRIHVEQVLLFLPATIAGMHFYGIEGVAAGATISALYAAVRTSAHVTRLSGEHPFRSLVRPLVSVGLLVLAGWLFPIESASTWSALGIKTGMVILITAGWVLLFDRAFLKSISFVFRHLRNRRPVQDAS